jgi:hypothetical protein
MDTDQILSQKIQSLFPNQQTSISARVILYAYGTEDHEQEPTRVRLAILKLSGNDLDGLKKMTEFAKQDFRDILAWAEYPRQAKRSSMPDGPDKNKLIETDRAEYEEWLHS